MDFQQSFYFLGTIFMAFGIAIIITAIFFLWKIERKACQMKKNIEEKVNSCLNYKSGLKALINFFDWVKSRKEKE